MRDRIKQLMTDQHLNQQSFAEKLQISPASLSSIFNMRTEPTLKHVEAIRKAFPQINLEWLLYGVGPMFLDDSIPSPSPSAQSSGVGGQEVMIDFPDETMSTTPSSSGRCYSQRPQNGAFQVDSQVLKNLDKPQRKITEIRIFYDDQTWETFVPKK